MGTSRLLQNISPLIFSIIVFNSSTVPAAVTEVFPASYVIDKSTDCGSYCYHDWTGNQLIDGVYGTAPWSADLGNGNSYEWLGWVYDTTVNIDFDFGVQAGIDTIEVGTVQDNVEDVVIPDIRVYSSTDWINWSLVGSLITSESTLNNNQYFVLELSGLNISARYVRVAVSHNYNGPWTFVDEVNFYSPLYSDGDGDAVPDDADICPGGNDNVNTDGDTVPDFCDACPLDPANDADEDGICGDIDNCPLVTNADQANKDGDSTGDACNEGDDNDGDDWSNELDNCPDNVNLTQADVDLDGMGDACDICPLDADNDADIDGVCGDVDNCPIIANSDQADTPDNDGLGNACDPDDDNDGFEDEVDNCPHTYNNDQSDYDGDGEGDACDDDADGDNINDSMDACLGTGPRALVDASGCALNQLCPCYNNWKNRDAYVKCIAHAANDFREAGLIGDTKHGDVVSEAGKSVEHDGCGLLREGIEGSHQPLWVPEIANPDKSARRIHQ